MKRALDRLWSLLFLLPMIGCSPGGSEYIDEGEITVRIVSKVDSCVALAGVVKIDDLYGGVGIPLEFTTAGGVHTVEVLCYPAVGVRQSSWSHEVTVVGDTVLFFPCDTCLVE